MKRSNNGKRSKTSEFEGCRAEAVCGPTGSAKTLKKVYDLKSMTYITCTGFVTVCYIRKDDRAGNSRRYHFYAVSRGKKGAISVQKCRKRQSCRIILFFLPNRTDMRYN